MFTPTGSCDPTMSANLPAVYPASAELISAAQVLVLPTGQYGVTLRECRHPIMMLKGMPAPSIRAGAWLIS
jgi:hypothetical protein